MRSVPPPPVTNTNIKLLVDHYSAVLERNYSDVCVMGDFNMGNINWELTDDPGHSYVPLATLVLYSWISFMAINCDSVAT